MIGDSSITFLDPLLRLVFVSKRFSISKLKSECPTDHSALAGPGIAAEMTLTGNVYGAEWALSKGLVNEVVPSTELIERARIIAMQIADNPPLAVKATKQLLNSNYPDLRRVIEAEHFANGPIHDTMDRLEAVNAFLEKREPKFE